MPPPQPDTRVSIVTSVHNAFDEVRRCLESVLRHTEQPYSLILVDDGSTDPRTSDVLRSYSGSHPHVRLLENNRHLGYTASVNRGCRDAFPDDVVLLNSDTVVTRGWLLKIQQAALSSDLVATVTPLSNAAGAFSIPENNTVNEFPPAASVARFGRLVEELSPALWPRVPTGNGYCMYIRREVFDKIGYFDEVNFPWGYGEENDFCMRATNMGFVHLIDDRTFIYHSRGASFGHRREELIRKGEEVLRKLHPAYMRLIEDWLSNDPLEGFRAKLKDHLRQWQET